MLKVELGGGDKPLPGFVNIDKQPGVRVQHVLDLSHEPLPFDDDSVSEVYSSHFLEHVLPIQNVLHEIARVCRIGAKVEIRVPHWNQSMAMCGGHLHTVSEDVVRNFSERFVEDWWGGRKKRLRLLHVQHVPSANFNEAVQAFPKLSAEQVMKFVPDTCHETRFTFDVVDNATKVTVTESVSVLPERCRVCGAGVEDLHLIHRTTTGPWFRCLCCGSDTSLVTPEDARSEYDEKYLSHITDRLGGLEAAVVEMTSNLDWFDEFSPPSKLFLDIGCLEGAGMEGMRRRGWEAHGFDVIPSVMNDKVTSETFKHGLFLQQFSAIMLREVIEHVPEWRDLLNECRLALLPDGLLQVQTPRPHNAPNWSEDVTKDVAYQRVHLQLFSPLALRTELVNAGFDVIAEETWPAGQKFMARRKI